jgi:hypothetical protein
VQPDSILSLYPVQICSFEENEGIVTVKYVNPNPSFIDKYIFAFFGHWFAQKFHKEKKYSAIWGIRADYGGFSAMMFRSIS